VSPLIPICRPAGGPDLVCLTIPAHRSLDVLRDCARMEVKA